LKVDERGNVYVGPRRRVQILSPSGRRLGSWPRPELPANFAWGDADGRTFYLTARTGLYRIRSPWPARAGIRTEPNRKRR
jgi:gluconolactonase